MTFRISGLQNGPSEGSSVHESTKDPSLTPAASGSHLVVVDGVGGVLAAVGVGPGALAVAGHGQGPAGVVFDAVVVFAQGGEVPDGGGSAAGVRDDVVGFAPFGVAPAAGESAGAVALLDEPAHRRVGEVFLDAGLDDHPGAFVEQDPGDAGVELAQDPGDDVAADHPDAGDLVAHGADLRPGRLDHRVRVRHRLAEVVGVRQ